MMTAAKNCLQQIKSGHQLTQLAFVLDLVLQMQYVFSQYICTTMFSITLHNVYIREYLFLRTEQAGTYLKICHSTYICPILFSPKDGEMGHGEISIFVSLKL